MKMKSNIAFYSFCCLAGLAMAISFVSPLGAQETDNGTSESTNTSRRQAESGSKKTFDLTFDDLKFEMEKGSRFTRSLLTPEINEYDNSTVRLRGYIRPSFSQKGLTKFIFVRDNKECCFGPGAALYDCVLVRMEPGKKTDYTVRPVTIEGKFSLKEYKGPDGNIWSIYRMKDANMK